MKRICVYCGSSPGSRPIFRAAAKRLGEELARRGIGLVYGGASVGVMGAVADAVVDAGGEAIGVIPESLVSLEVAHSGLTELRVVDSMHTRKAMMADLSDAFIALPGGLGTLEELFEMLTWSQLRIHQKPVGLLNVEGFYDALLAFLDETVEAGFVRPPHRANLLVGSEPADVMTSLENWAPPEIEKWWEEPR